MSRRKRLGFLVLAVILAMGMLGGCGSPEGAQDSQGSGSGGAASNATTGARLTVVATNFPAYDFARQVAGDVAEVSMLLPPGAESHSFEPTPSDIIKIQKCNLFICVGGESETWVEGILESIDSENLRVLRLMDCVPTVTEVIVEGMQDEEEGHEPADNEGGEPAAEAAGEAEVEYDEHVWTSPENAKRIAQNISSILCELDAQDAQVFEANTASYLTQLDALDAQFKDVVAQAKRTTLVFGDRFPFRYFTDAYGLDYFAAFPGCSTESEASPQTIAFLIDKVQSEQIPVVFKIELSSHGIAETIAEDTGAQVLTLNSAHNVSLDEMNSGETYLSLMERNVEVLREALN
jgi:zinc transport system substrate-binding protein